MEAKDTVINEEEMRALHRFEDFRLALIYQAEISFPLGKQEGIREVVEWLNNNPCSYEKWQAKLKEWGIDGK